MSCSSPVPADHPLMIAWKAYKATEHYENTKRWATDPKYSEGSLWAAFADGFNARAKADAIIAVGGGDHVPGVRNMVSQDSHTDQCGSQPDLAVGGTAALATHLRSEIRRLSAALVFCAVRVGTPGEIVNASQRGQALADVRRACDEALDFVPPTPPASTTPETGTGEEAPSPVKLVLFCPSCGFQHIDAPDERTPDWTNPPHRSHLCHGCGHIWRPADVPTEGVAALETVGKNDSPTSPPPLYASPAQPKAVTREEVAEAWLGWRKHPNAGPASRGVWKDALDRADRVLALTAALSADEGER